MTYNVAVVREVSASPEKVWSLVTDLPRMGEWSPENLGGEWLNGATCAAVGATFKGNNKNGEKTWQTVVIVEVCDAPKKFMFSLKFKELHLSDWVYEIEPTTSGCRVTHAWVAGTHWEQFAPFGKDISGVEDRATHNLRNMGVTLDNLVNALK
ncbi:MAG: SRPBCC family protein [Actinobacteria bacterium]|nr:SRPBCC family protein [Actinomycetota bacterium]